MKKYLFILTLCFVCVNVMADEPEDDPKYKRTFGVIFGPGYQSSFQQLFHVGVRGTYVSDKFFSLGLELAYLQRFEQYGNADFYNVTAFGRINPWKGIFAEAGVQYYDYLSSARTQTKAGVLPFVSIGYEIKIKERKKVELQYRPYNLNDLYPFSNAPSKIFAGFTYLF